MVPKELPFGVQCHRITLSALIFNGNVNEELWNNYEITMVAIWIKYTNTGGIDGVPTFNHVIVSLK